MGFSPRFVSRDSVTHTGGAASLSVHPYHSYFGFLVDLDEIWYRLQEEGWNDLIFTFFRFILGHLKAPFAETLRYSPEGWGFDSLSAALWLLG